MTGDAARAARAAAAAALPNRIAFLGLGLIGGSIALALREAGATARFAAWTPSGRGSADAVLRGIVDEAPSGPEPALDGAGLVILAGPPLAILEELDFLGGPWRGSLAAAATVTDVGSTKARIVAAADSVGLSFVGGHPMAGRETTGVESATPDLFVDRPWVIIPGGLARDADIERVGNLARATGARPTHGVAAAEHDAAVAAISHLPLVLSATLAEAVTGDPAWPLARSLAASGWRDMSRLAKGDPDMGAGILATNAPTVAERLRAFRDALDAWIAQLEAVSADEAGQDARAFRRRLEAARVALSDPER